MTLGAKSPFAVAWVGVVGHMGLGAAVPSTGERAQAPAACSVQMLSLRSSRPPGWGGGRAVDWAAVMWPGNTDPGPNCAGVDQRTRMA